MIGSPGITTHFHNLTVCHTRCSQVTSCTDPVPIENEAKQPAFPPRIFQGEIECACLFLVNPSTMVFQQGGWHTVGQHVHI